MNAPVSLLPSNPVVGQHYGQWVWNGSFWVCSSTTPGIQVITTVFTVSGAYMPSPGLQSLVVECLGGGGAGGGAGPPNVAGQVLVGGGGGSGAYARKTLAASLVLGGAVVTIGAGGTGMFGQLNGNPGGNTSFGALCVANGGLGGNGNLGGVSNQWGYGGAGGAAAIGDYLMPGSDGDSGLVLPAPTGAGNLAISGGKGGATFGGNHMSYIAEGQWIEGANGSNGTGAGGSGAILNQLPTTSGTAGGGVGGSGVCIVTEYCWQDASAGASPCPPCPPARVAGCGPGWGMPDC